MDGKDAWGRHVNLLNAESQRPGSPSCIRSFTEFLELLTPGSSTCSQRSRSPPTPNLERSASTDSINLHTPPGPATPEERSFDSFRTATKMASPNAESMGYPLMLRELPRCSPLALTLPYHPRNPANTAPAYVGAQQHVSDNQPSSPSAFHNARPKKTSFPCPMAEKYRCHDSFTTSGHAARHAKKHTGKKDAICPDCRKAFTRKDNMEQHRRTHQSGRNASKGAANGVRKARQPSKRPKPTPIQSLLASPLPPVSTLGPLYPAQPLAAAMATPPQPMETFKSAYPDPTAYSMTSNYSAGSSPSSGLDALAIVASGEERKREA